MAKSMNDLINELHSRVQELQEELEDKDNYIIELEGRVEFLESTDES
jgi:predicted  nucleic acid-binding Zn-ribbon protein